MCENLSESYRWLIVCIDLCPQSVGMALRDLIRSVDDILPTLHESIRTEVQYIVCSLFAVFSHLLTPFLYWFFSPELLSLWNKKWQNSSSDTKKQRGSDHFIFTILAEDTKNPYCVYWSSFCRAVFINSSNRVERHFAYLVYLEQHQQQHLCKGPYTVCATCMGKITWTADSVMQIT